MRHAKTNGQVPTEPADYQQDQVFLSPITTTCLMQLFKEASECTHAP